MAGSVGQYTVQLPDGESVLVDLGMENGQYVARVNGVSHRLSVVRGPNGSLAVSIDGHTYRVCGTNGTSALVDGASRTSIATLVARNAGAAQLTNASGGRTGRAAQAQREVRSPLTGLVIDVAVEEGEAVERGQTLLVIEAMKMENRISAPCDGRIEKLSIAAGKTVKSGDLLLVLMAG